MLPSKWAKSFNLSSVDQQPCHRSRPRSVLPFGLDFAILITHTHGYPTTHTWAITTKQPETKQVIHPQLLLPSHFADAVAVWSSVTLISWLLDSSALIPAAVAMLWQCVVIRSDWRPPSIDRRRAWLLPEKSSFCITPLPLRCTSGLWTKIGTLEDVVVVVVVAIYQRQRGCLTKGLSCGCRFSAIIPQLALKRVISCWRCHHKASYGCDVIFRPSAMCLSCYGNGHWLQFLKV